ncbi:MAG: hypothetical protein KAT05_06970, partial [Spirochaetes bacterium]|nr:hypothetical protein [Spirochaetota bacterium]
MDNRKLIKLILYSFIMIFHLNILYLYNIPTLLMNVKMLFEFFCVFLKKIIKTGFIVEFRLTVNDYPYLNPRSFL